MSKERLILIEDARRILGKEIADFLEGALNADVTLDPIPKDFVWIKKVDDKTALKNFPLLLKISESKEP